MRSNRENDSTWRSRYEDQYQNSFIINEVQNPRDFGKFTEEEDYTSKFSITQISMKKNIKEFGDDDAKANITEFNQFDEK